MKRYIGVMSGTSCDGADVVLVDFSHGIELQSNGFYPYPSELRTRIQQLIQYQSVTVKDYSRIDAELGHFFADAVNDFINSNGLNRHDIIAIGLHGQTVYHDPEHQLSNTLQIGSAPITAHETGIQTVANFRQMDLASGGQGAPLAPILHLQLFTQAKSYVVVNLGGIANITYLKDNGVVGFDTGPASCLMDEWIFKHQNLPFDEQGRWAQQGRIHQPILAAMLTDPYFNLPYPKSTGRELFNQVWLAKHLNKHDVNPVDVQRTLLQLTVESLAQGIEQLGVNIDEVICCGGGVHNSFLMEQISTRIPAPVIDSSAYGLNADFIEGILMAWLAMQRVNRQALDLSTITGAKMAMLYGVIHQPAS